MVNLTFKEVVEDHFPLLETYTPVLVRVHGENHPELAQVRDIFFDINTKVKELGLEKVDLTSEFDQLRRVTDNYEVPKDGCETYEASYEMLEASDKAYST